MKYEFTYYLNLWIFHGNAHGFMKNYLQNAISEWLSFPGHQRVNIWISWLDNGKRSGKVVSQCLTWGLFYWHGLTLIPAWISNYIHYEVWDEITYPFLNFNGATVEV